MSADTIRIGIIGAGGNTRSRHIPGLKAQDGVELVAVANRSRESSERAAAEFDLGAAVDTWEEIMLDDEIDAVCIGTWPYMHAPLTIAALESGKHVLVEARMASNSLEAQAMLDTLKANPGLVGQVVPAPHSLGVDQTVIDKLSDGYVGELIAVEGFMASGSNFPEWDSPVHWRHDRDLSGNNIMTMGILYEAMMRWVGPAATVQALGQTVVKHRDNEDGRRIAMTIPDHVDILCRLEQGGQMRFAVSAVIGHAPAMLFTIYGTEGTIRIEGSSPDDMGISAGRKGDAGLAPVEITDEKRGGWRVEEEFINAIRGLEPVTHTDFYTGVRYMEWSDAVTRSLRTGELVNLPLDAN
ncbi:MAG: Gfo/Idh/MocA family oxidoreductase [Chloroflexi bacterium]|nr:Gfo/Idh/MocA family oxidoreductase [Chloroflexota bacterium]